MGKLFFDQYSYLHFATGIIFYHFKISLKTSFIIHTIFEYAENTDEGMNIINTTFKNIWPGGKNYKDSLTNNIGDTIFFILGWLSANEISKYYK